MSVNHDRSPRLRRLVLAIGTAGVLAAGAGAYAVTHVAAAGPAGGVVSAPATNAPAPAETPDAPESGTPAETPGAPESGTAAEPTTPETDGPGGWADPAGSQGAVDQQGEN
jgi:hypothetical protein